MRLLNIFLMLIMLLFAIVQYNDPDGPVWMLIYMLPAVWAGIAAFRNSALAGRMVNTLLIVSMFAAALGVLYYWPDAEGWWRQEVWWEVESAREGMGMMVVFIVLFVVWLSRPRKNTGSDSHAD
jgi:hypothetical protein